jgi:hypothetical protein
VGDGYFRLQGLQAVIVELDDFATFGTHHMVVVLSQVMVLVAQVTVVEAALVGEAESAHQLQRVSHKIGIQPVAIVVQQRHQFGNRNVVFGLQKSFKNDKPVFKIGDAFLFKQFLKLSFFLFVQAFHLEWPGNS